MKRYVIDYISSTDHDVCHVWTNATDEDDAISQVYDEYWDVEEIVGVHEE